MRFSSYWPAIRVAAGFYLSGSPVLPQTCDSQRLTLNSQALAGRDS